MHEDGKNDIDARESIKDKKIDIDMWDYNVQLDMLPSYIRPSLANKILTIGQTVIMFGNDPRQKKGKKNCDFQFFKKKKISYNYIVLQQMNTAICCTIKDSCENLSVYFRFQHDTQNKKFRLG